MSKFVVSGNYRDRESEHRWLVRREDDPIDKALAVKSLIARGVRFIPSQQDELGFGCDVVATADSVEVDAEKSGGQKLRFVGKWFYDEADTYVPEVDVLSLSASGEVRSIPLSEDVPAEPVPAPTEPKVVKADVLKAIDTIRETAATTEGDGRVNVDVAMTVVRALENELGDSPIVQIESGGVDYARIADLMADDVADRVVARLETEVRAPLPDGVPAVPWRAAPGGDSGYSADDRLVLYDSDFLSTPVFQEGGASPSATIRAIVEAMNAHFAPRVQPPTLAEAVTVPDYDAADIPAADQRPAA